MPQYWFDHVHLISRDVERAAKFYEDNFSAKRVSVTPTPDGGTSIELSLSGMRLLARSAREAETTHETAKGYGLDHFGIRTDNIEATVAALKRAGVPFRDEIREVRPGLRIAFFWAPDNVLVELLEKKTT